MRGERPEGAVGHARANDAGLEMELIVWGGPPPPGDALCLMLTGRTEDDLVQEILDGRYDALLRRGGAR